MPPSHFGGRGGLNVPFNLSKIVGSIRSRRGRGLESHLGLGFFRVPNEFMINILLGYNKVFVAVWTSTIVCLL